MTACTCSWTNSGPIAVGLVWLLAELNRCPSSHSTQHLCISNYPQAIAANYKMHVWYEVH